jgi:hypothetical protein
LGRYPGQTFRNLRPLSPIECTLFGQQLRFNATVAYPDGTPFPQSGAVSAYLLYSGTPTVNDSVPMVFDTTLGFWVGSYTARSSDIERLWSLIVKASDSPTPANTGTATRAIIIENNPPASFPLYYFGIVAALIADRSLLPFSCSSAVELLMPD